MRIRYARGERPGCLIPLPYEVVPFRLAVMARTYANILASATRARVRQHDGTTEAGER